MGERKNRRIKAIFQNYLNSLPREEAEKVRQIMNCKRLRPGAKKIFIINWAVMIALVIVIGYLVNMGMACSTLARVAPDIHPELAYTCLQWPLSVIFQYWEILVVILVPVGVFIDFLIYRKAYEKIPAEECKKKRDQIFFDMKQKAAQKPFQ